MGEKEQEEEEGSILCGLLGLLLNLALCGVSLRGVESRAVLAGLETALLWARVCPEPLRPLSPNSFLWGRGWFPQLPARRCEGQGS